MSSTSTKPKLGDASITVTGLSGKLLAELPFDIGFSIGELKATLLPIIAPSETAQLMLAFDGSEPDEKLTLVDMGIQPSELAHFTAVIYDALLLARIEINQLHRDAIERSRREAAEERKRLIERREELIAQRRERIEAEYAARHNHSHGPLLMLTAEPANALPALEKVEVPSVAAPGQDVQCDGGPLILGGIVDCPASKVTCDWRDEATAVTAAYNAFFDHISFRKEWKQPPFTRAEAELAFLIAACVVARIRRELLDIRNRGMKIRQLEGSARDWMHSVENAKLLHNNPNMFIAGLVHATFKDARGYVEDLTRREVDEMIIAYRAQDPIAALLATMTV